MEVRGQPGKPQPRLHLNQERLRHNGPALQDGLCLAGKGQPVRRRSLAEIKPSRKLQVRRRLCLHLLSLHQGKRTPGHFDAQHSG